MMEIETEMEMEMGMETKMEKERALIALTQTSMCTKWDWLSLDPTAEPIQRK